MTDWRATITLTADGKETHRVEIADAQLDTVLTNLPKTTEDFISKTVRAILNDVRMEHVA